MAAATAEQAAGAAADVPSADGPAAEDAHRPDDAAGTTAPRPPGARATLSPLEESILEFERKWWRRGPAKDEQIRREFGISPTAYYLQLHNLINRADAEAYDPLLVQRVARRMEQGRRWREGNAE